MENLEDIAVCSARLCDYGVNEEGLAGCSGGAGSCRVAALVEIAESSYHTPKLKEATKAINAVLKLAHPGPADHTLSFLRTNSGVHLRWVRHGMSLDEMKGWSTADDPVTEQRLGLEVEPDLPDPCLSGLCSFGFDTGECRGGGGDCWAAHFREASVSPLHPGSVNDATKAIKSIFRLVEGEANGRKLSLVHTENGTILVWARHSERAEEEPPTSS